MTGIAASAPPVQPPASGSRAFAGPPLGRDEIEPMPAEVTFGEFLTALNPLHHIPIVGWVYRQITGETIQPAFRVLGGLLTGGPIGAIASAVGALAEELIGPIGSGATAVAAATPAASPGASPSRFADAATSGGQALQPLPLATRLAARAYPAPVVPLASAEPKPATADPAAGFLPAAAPGPATAAPAPEAPVPVPAAAPGITPGRIRRAPVVPVSSGGQDPAFVQRMMQGLEAYERTMRARTAPAAP